jgi:EAL and modified HD-GYP domain-containing signal transduction protein
VIDKDLGLSLRLLRYINSAYFGMRGEITSIRQAVMMLGARGVSRWALLVALTGGPTASRELCVMALTRARMCEQLLGDRTDADLDQVFTVGLLSLADALLDMPLESILAELPLSEDVNHALLWRAGTAGEVLEATVAFEQGNFDAYSLKPYRRSAPRVYRDALRWSQDTLIGVV